MDAKRIPERFSIAEDGPLDRIDMGDKGYQCLQIAIRSSRDVLESSRYHMELEYHDSLNCVPHSICM